MIEISKTAVLTRQHRDLLEFAELECYKSKQKKVFFQPLGRRKWVSIHKVMNDPGIKMRIFFTPDRNSSLVTHTAFITKFEDKRELSSSRKQYIERYIPLSEEGLFGLKGDDIHVNLLEIRELTRFKNPIQFSIFRKASGEKYLSNSYMQYQFVLVKNKSEDWIKRKLSEEPIEDEYFALEGERYKGEGIFIRRNRLIVQQAMRQYLPICEACGIEMKNIYGELGNGYIQFHHREPLGELSQPRYNSYKDLAPLCPNCHTMIHKTKPIISVAEFSIKNVKN